MAGLLKRVFLTVALAGAAYLLVHFVQSTPALLLLRVAHLMPSGIEPRLLTYAGQACVLAALFAVLRVPASSWRGGMGLHGGLRAALWLTMAATLFSTLVVFSLLSNPSSPDAAGSFSSLVAQMASEYPVWGLAGRLLGHVLVGPTLEEFLFRALILGFLLKAANRWVALLISSVLFASVHSNWIFALFSGLFYGLLYLRYRSVWLCILAHSANNLLPAALVPLSLSYLHEAGYFMPLGATLVGHQLAWLAATLACFAMFVRLVLGADATCAPERRLPL